MKYLPLCLFAAGMLVLPVQRLRAAAYQDAVIALSPTYYYQLNEATTNGGVIDTMGRAAPGTYNGDYVASSAEFVGLRRFR